jgi:hypothetical protein
MQVGGIYEQRDAQSITYILDNPALIYETGYKVLQSQGGKGVLKCNHLTHNGKDKLVYDISKYKSFVSMATMLDGVAFLNAFINLLDAVIMVKNNGFMQYDNVDFNFDNIYIDTGSYRVFLLYVPVNIGGFTNDVSYFLDRFVYCCNDYFNKFISNNDIIFSEVRNIVCNGQNNFESMKKALVDLNNEKNNALQESSPIPPSKFQAKGMFATNDANDLQEKLNSIQNTGSINYADLNKALENKPSIPISGEVSETVDISGLLKEIQRQLNINQSGVNQGGMNPQGVNQMGMNPQGMNSQGANFGGMNMQGMAGSVPGMNMPGMGVNSYGSKSNGIANDKGMIKHFQKMESSVYGGLDDSSIGIDEWTDRHIREQQRKGRSRGRNGSKQPVGNNRPVKKNSNARPIAPEIRLISDDESGELEFIIDKDEFTLGKNFNVVDGFIPYNEGISRVHCMIVCDEGEYFLVDLGSLNGTYINGARIPVKSHVPIAIGDIIGIANIEFVVEEL